MKRYLRFGLRSKLMALSLFLFAVPWLGYQYVWEMESFLRLGQEKTLLGTAKAVATALHERPLLFDQHASFQQKVERGKDLYAYNLNSAIRLDGELEDWPQFLKRSVEYDLQYLLPEYTTNTQPSLSFRHTVGQFNQYLYLAFEVTDDNVIYRRLNSLSVDRNDYLEIAIQTDIKHSQLVETATQKTTQTSTQTAITQFKRYIFSTHQNGWVNAYPVNDINRAELPEKQIQGYWRQTSKGYNLELRMPVAWVGAKVGFAIYDVDDNDTRQIVSAIGTSDTRDAEQLGTVLVPSPEIDAIIKGLSYNQSRIWVVDKHGRVLARSGSIIPPQAALDKNALSSQAGNAVAPNHLYQMLNWLQQYLLQPIYYKILTKPSQQFIDQLKDAVQLEDKLLGSALTGQSETLWRLTPDNQAVILSAAHPIFIDGQVLGAVVVEETTHGIRSLRNKALESLFNRILLILLLGSCVFVLFASRISSRIALLRDQVEKSVDEQGRILQAVPASKTNDEIGDLSRSFADLVERLSQYNRYLESMSSRMSHEFKTPVAIIRSSLENLNTPHLTPEGEKYKQRAMDGVQRLNSMLSAMSEATRLEQAIHTEEKEQFDLAQVVSGCVAGHQLAFSQNQFDCQILPGNYLINGSPDLIAQMMDKLLANAIEFSPIEQPITITLFQAHQTIILQVLNAGKLLPDTMQDRIFDSMVSVRNQATTDKPHLGLGLYIARLVAEFHQAKIVAKNRQDGIEGVCIELSLN